MEDTLEHGHLDRINDVSFDSSGSRMATCSSDMCVKIWKRIENHSNSNNDKQTQTSTDNQNTHKSNNAFQSQPIWPSKGGWVNTHKIQAHNGPVWKVSWADPHFGQIIATCSFDRRAIVFEETACDFNSDTETVWTQRNLILDSQASVIDIKFGPKKEGLILALASVDGLIQVYQALSPWNLTVWVQHSKIRCLKGCTLTSISWSTVETLPTLLATGANGGNVSGDRKERFALFELVHNANGADCDGKELYWMRVSNPVIDIESPTCVYEVAFAPSVGRMYHLLAIATDEIRVVKIEVPFSSLVNDCQTNPRDQTQMSSSAHSEYIFTSETILKSTAGKSTEAAAVSSNDICYRLSWNSFGTILGASQGDGSVSLYKQNYSKKWTCISKLNPQASLSSSVPTSILSASTLSSGLNKKVHINNAAPVGASTNNTNYSPVVTGAHNSSRIPKINSH